MTGHCLCSAVTVELAAPNDASKSAHAPFSAAGAGHHTRRSREIASLSAAWKQLPDTRQASWAKDLLFALRDPHLVALQANRQPQLFGGDFR